MTNRTRNLLLFVVLAGAALGTWIVAREPDVAQTTRSAAPSPARSFYMDLAEFYETDAAGRIQYRVEADRVEQAEGGDELSFDVIRVRYAPETDVNWDISAARGIASENLGRLQLVDDVRLTLTPGGNRDDLLFRTSDLLLDADGQIVSTEERVSLTKGEAEFVGTGLIVDLASDHWTFLSEVIIGSPR